MRQYKILNNILGWVVFAVAAFTYLMTIEPTASFWDCPEFIAQGYKLEIGHPPGNPIFILAARFVTNFVSDPSKVAMAVNSMSALLSAATILLLFWTVTHLVKRLVVKDDAESVSLTQMLVIFGSGLCGALVYTWSDTFWFSAVEAEVYAFSSFCTALVFWLILKWEDRCDEEHSDRWLLLIAYVIGVSIGVHLLNLLCIPAIVLVFYYKKYSNTSVKGSLIALLVSFVIVFLILYGLVPGFVEMAQWFDLLFVNTLGMSYNSGVIAYTILDIAVFAWCVYELYKQSSVNRIKASFLLSVVFSGMLMIGDNLLIPVVLAIALAVYLWKFCKKIPVRIFTLTILSIFVIFVGFMSYAVILIRSNANTPLNENAPDNVFSLGSYLSREQYGETPLFYGPTFNSDIVYVVDGNVKKPIKHEGRAQYAKAVKANPSEPDHYVMTGYKSDYKNQKEMNMLFPRMHSGAHAREYQEWINMVGEPVEVVTTENQDGSPAETAIKTKPTFVENLQFFLDYQLSYMYWRYFMWNFAGRQNDIQGSGEITQGNWISGIPVIDNARLGDQSLLPDDLGAGNKGHNVFYMLPLIFGIIGLLWQAYADKRGIEQFWVVFFLFFMTGIAIVLYLNQTPSQPRERDYAYAGSFYAFSIWVGMGVAGIWKLLCMAINRKKNVKTDAEKAQMYEGKNSTIAAAIACVLGLLVPLQMVSQTWDDHDRSGRTACRDFGMNYLSGVEKNGIVFCNGDNDTFPLWYAQEVEGYRTDVRVVNLSYLSTDWYISQMQVPTYESEKLPMLADKNTFAYSKRQYNYFIDTDTSTIVPALKSLEHLYSSESMNNSWGLPTIKYPHVVIPVDAEAAIKQGIVNAKEKEYIVPGIALNLENVSGNGMTSSQVMSLDIIASSIAQGWKRPIYFAMTVPTSYYIGLSPYMRNTGMTYEVTPLISSTDGDTGVDSDKMYKNITTKFKWGGLDTAKPGSLYLDETIRRMVTTVRSAMLDLTSQLIGEGLYAKRNNDAKLAADRFAKAAHILQLMEQKLPIKSSPYSLQTGQEVANCYATLADATGNQSFKQKALSTLEGELMRYGQYVRFYQSLSPDQYNRLNQYDMYIDRRLFADLLYAYHDLNPAGSDKMVEKLTRNGVNVERILQMQQAAQQYQQQQAEQQRMADSINAAQQEMGSDQAESEESANLFGSN